MTKRFLRNRHGFVALGALLLAGSLSAEAKDWPVWRGPAYDGISTETGWSASWPGEGPKQLWKAEVGTGFSSMTVSKGLVYTMGNKKIDGTETDTVYCFDAATGKEVWKQSYACQLDAKYYAGGTGGSPTVDGQNVYTFSKRGHLYSFDAATGKINWTKNLVEELGLKIPTWGFACSAYIDGNLLLLNAGAAGTAVDKTNGKVVWKSAPSEAGYATAVPFDYKGDKCVALLGAKALRAVTIKDGKELWQFPWQTDYDVNAADPIIKGNSIFISSGYNKGCAVIDVSGDAPKEVWKSKIMRCHFNTCVAIGDYIYGVDGDAGNDQADLKCFEFKTGNLKWKQGISGTGTIMAADGKLIVLSGNGELILAQATPDAYKGLAKAQVLASKKNCWIVPVLANGKLYCRNAAGTLICLDVAK